MKKILIAILLNFACYFGISQPVFKTKEIMNLIGKSRSEVVNYLRDHYYIYDKTINSVQEFVYGNEVGKDGYKVRIYMKDGKLYIFLFETSINLLESIGKDLRYNNFKFDEISGGIIFMKNYSMKLLGTISKSDQTIIQVSVSATY